MSEERFGLEIRDAFDSTHEPNPGLDVRVLAAIPWEAPQRRRISWPRIGGALAGAVAVVAIVALVAPGILSRLNVPIPGIGGNPDAPAYSLAAVDGSSAFIVQRKTGNILLQSRDGGRTWSERLRFAGVYDGMQMYGQDGFIWSIEMYVSPCSGSSCSAPKQPGYIFRTGDGGVTWTPLPVPTFPVNGVFFLDGLHGWIDSGSPMGGLGNDVLYSTVDGGQTWQLVGPLPRSAPMGWVYGAGQYHVTFSSALRGWYLGNNQMFTTADGGHSWQPVDIPLYGVVTISQPAFFGVNGVLPVAYRDPAGPDNATANLILFYSSHDGGVTWSDPRTAPAGFGPVGDIVSIAILDLQHIWLTSQSETGGDNVQASPAVARTSDGGLTWTVVKHTPRILQMTFSDATHGFALDVTGEQNVNGILSTHDAGATWQRVNVPVFG